MKTAIITGASSGLGQEFAEHVTEYFPEIECVWLIARRAERLYELAPLIKANAEVLPLDLCSDRDMTSLAAKFELEKPEVDLLINCAGCGYLGNVGETDTELFTRSIDLNVRALTSVTNIVLPFMREGGNIINISSIASFCPNPRMTVYSSTKAYVTSFSLGLREELRPRKIGVTAVCPGPMATEFIEVGNIAGNSKMFKTLPYSDPKKVAAGSMRAAKRNRAVYTPKAFYKFYRFIAKIIPRSLLVKFVKT